MCIALLLCFVKCLGEQRVLMNQIISDFRILHKQLDKNIVPIVVRIEPEWVYSHYNGKKNYTEIKTFAFYHHLIGIKHLNM